MKNECPQHGLEGKILRKFHYDIVKSVTAIVKGDQHMSYANLVWATTDSVSSPTKYRKAKRVQRTRSWPQVDRSLLVSPVRWENPNISPHFPQRSPESKSHSSMRVRKRQCSQLPFCSFSFKSHPHQPTLINCKLEAP